MGLPDATAGAQLAAGFFRPAWVAYLDFSGDPVRATTAPANLTFAATGDVDLDGFTFIAVDPTVVSVSDVKNAEGGSDTLTFALSGIVGPDTALLNIIGNTTLWRGRPARLWAVIYNESGAQQGAVWPFYTGRMSSAQITGAPEFQTVQVDVENYLASLKQASGRNYLDQKQYDASDNTAALKIGVANGSLKGVAAVQLPASQVYVPSGYLF